MKKNVFITGASGCVGHYIIQECLKHDNLQLHLLCRSPHKLKIDYKDNPSITLHKEDFLNIESLEDVIKDMHYIVHIITSWGNDQTTYDINVEKTKKLFLMANPELCERIIYFSTASILGKGNKTIVEAEKYGSGYVRTKYQAHQMIETLPMKDRITTVFPTLVFGGNEVFPQSHINSGLVPNMHYLKWILPFYFEGAFHFLHSEDIAQVSVHLMLNEHDKREYALGQAAITLKEALATVAKVFNKWQPFQVKVSWTFIMKLAGLLRIKIGPWEKYCMENSYMVFDTVNPEDFDLKSKFPTFESLINDIKRCNLK